MFESVLIANRGEIACRIVRTAQALGMRTIAVHSQADADALFVQMADEAWEIGPAPAAESYLRIDKVIDVALKSGAQCIHPGYGFLSERAEFAEACAENGIAFIGPPASAIKAMGLKDAAKALAQKAGVPVVPGYHGSRQEPDFLRQKAYEIGYPVLIKAVAGGGGKGMKRVDKATEFDDALASAMREAQASFGDPRVLVEKYVLSPRHVEIQIFADQHGNVVHLNERDCSLQRRHQKVVEEAPAPGMTPDMRAAMGKAAVEAARAVGYVGAGTVEFIADGREGLRPDRFYFMEMNTRLQVEHPVTEAVTGLDLVALQFRVAHGEALSFTQEEVRLEGHAVEARLYAEDPEKGFLPSTGRLWALELPEDFGIRVDSGVEAGDEVSPFYDPMIAKIIARGADRDEALDRLSQALGETLVAGPRTNAAFLKKLVDAQAFREGAFDTGFIDRNLEQLGAVERPLDPIAVAAGALALVRRDHDRNALAGSVAIGDLPGPWWASDGFQLVGQRQTGLPLMVDGTRIEGALTWDAEGPAFELPGAKSPPGAVEASVVEAGETMLVLREGRQTRVAIHDPTAVDLEHLDAGGLIKAPMHGKLVALFVETGQSVEKGQRVAVVEAMKMEHVLTAPLDGVIGEIAAAIGDQVGEGARITVVLEEGDTA
ncbi:acetyl/propionyl/methylcrotonyl-CoA carboxylase subunit alpha [Saliniramus sp.]|uniref:acetyl/propionyl/methylcrotonyl-CoA carboxylase subunit alpha n=1 Tax=Saliniramus sp. TaxID=2986772 RepID=UPI002C19BB4E|nr:acetyl/propionyl/methylcrotonyl-CoA carboxylase subunit alpha [Saliniramus sp.]HMB10591.1 acetyl/propionyl/methylcrotonyl-CoA carboxylase subunit alpha [Saliniramus sp.]